MGAIDAQTTYQMEMIETETPIQLKFYETDLWNSSAREIFTVDLDRFQELSGFGGVLFQDFELSPDRSQVYIVDSFGELFRYDIETAEILRLVDLAAYNSSTADRLFHQTLTLEFVSDSLLIAGGYITVSYNIYTGEKDVLFVHPNIYSFQKDSCQPKFLTPYRDTYIGYDTDEELRGVGPQIFQVDLRYPRDAVSLLYIDNPYYYKELIEVRTTCDSTELWILGDDRMWYHVDMSTGILTPRVFIFNPDGRSFLVGVKHYPEMDWLYCDHYIDLDDDDDTADGEDFYYQADCRPLDLPIADDDLKIVDQSGIDSIVVRVLSADSDHERRIDSGRYDVLVRERHMLTLVPRLTTTILEMSAAISSVRYSYYGDMPLDSLKVEVILYGRDGQSPKATAIIGLAAKIPDAGPDRSVSVCVENRSISFEQLLRTEQVEDASGTFLDSQYDRINSESWQIDMASIDTMYYVVKAENCTDTSQWILEVAEPVSVRFENDDIDTVYMSGLSLYAIVDGEIDSVYWSPAEGLSCTGCLDPYLTSHTVREYTVSVIDEMGCSSSASISLSYRSPPYYVANTIHPESQWQQNQGLYLHSKEIQAYDISVYDRWGNKVYYAASIPSNDLSYGWYPDLDVPSGVYIYQIKVNDALRTTLAGDVTVVR